MPTQLLEWENDFRNISEIKADKKRKAGVLLQLVPDHTRWEDFLVSVKQEWYAWRNDLQKYPACLVLLYSGLAFYEYDDNTFWPQFAHSVGSKAITGNQQTDINDAFAEAARRFLLPIRSSAKGTEFVGSSISYIGIPLSLWDGFLDICEWALWRKDWKQLNDKEWSETIERRAGGRKRLISFLKDNLITAHAFVQDMLDAREILRNDPGITIKDISQASILRSEYFEEVPETADFLRPQNPDSLFQDRARVVWDEESRRIYLQLPAVERHRLPARWHVAAHAQDAAHAPDRLVLNSDAFKNPVFVSLASANQTETQRIRGPEPWGLFDTERGGCLVNSNRDVLPLGSYVLISPNEVEVMSREGFDEDKNENPINERFELSDGTTCFITRLLPTGKYAELSIKNNNKNSKTIQFRTKAKIEARFFAGESEHSAYFNRIGDMVKIEQLPVLCVSIPVGYFRDDRRVLEKEFKVCIDDKLAGGRWENKNVRGSDDRNFYFWRWSGDRPVREIQSGKKVMSLRDIQALVSFPPLRGELVMSIKSKEFTVQYPIFKDDPKFGMDKCWANLPGAFLPMFLLCQTPKDEGMKWEDLLLAKEVIAPNSQISYPALHKYSEHGFLVQRGRRWFINESRSAFIKPGAQNLCQMDYCGDPSVLWGLYRLMYHRTQGHLPVIEVINKRGQVPYLQMNWSSGLRGDLEEYLTKHHVRIGTTLWTH